jgi:hypothetical protein
MEPISQTNRRVDLLCGITGDPIAIMKGAVSTAIRSVDLTGIYMHIWQCRVSDSTAKKDANQIANQDIE